MAHADPSSELATKPLGRLLLRFAIPSIFAQIVNLLYNIVDRIFVGRIPEIGPLALAGLGVAFPIILIISSFSFLAGMGGAPLASIAMGRGDNAKAERILGSACVFLLAMSVVLTVLCFWAMRPMLLMFGASEQTIGYAVDYFSLYLLGTPAVQLSLGLNYYISCQGFAKTSMMTVLIGAALNIILDPIFIYGLDMGCKGAALATICSQAVSAVWIFAFFFGKRTVLHFRRQYLRLDLKELVPVILLGLSPFFVQVTDCIVPLVMNAGMQQYGNDYYVGTMTVMFSIEQLLRLPADGLCQGAVPIMSYNYGAGKPERVKKTFFLILAFSFGFTTIASWLILLFPKTFIMPFTDSQQLIENHHPRHTHILRGHDVHRRPLRLPAHVHGAGAHQALPPRGHDAQARHPAPALLRPPQARLWDGRPALCGMHRRRPGLRHCICDFHLELQIDAQNPLTV